MLFNETAFVGAFLPITLIVFFALRRQEWRIAFLVVASLVFYAWATWWFPALMLFTSGVSYVAARAIHASEAVRRRKLILAAGVVLCLAQLVVFKYAFFSVHTTSEVLSTLTGRSLPSVEDVVDGIVLPAGISFFTFEAISYQVDVYRRELEPEPRPLRYLLFISFFPHLIAGPIVRYSALGPQLGRKVSFDPDRFRSGLLLFSIGLIKKVLLANPLAVRVDPLVAVPASLGAVSAWAAMIGYAFQILLDFSAYSDMALGLARMFGIELPYNFDRPYGSAGLREFWRRWHITLSTWLRDYLYRPLGGNRVSPGRRDVNLFVTMAIGGLWHGASMNFVLWGMWHGSLLVGQRHLERLPFRPPRFVSVAITFVLVVVGWVFFRISSLHDIRAMLGAMAGRNGLGALPETSLLLLIAGIGLWMAFVREEHRWRLPALTAPRVAAVAAVSALALVMMNQTQTFIYFAF